MEEVAAPEPPGKSPSHRSTRARWRCSSLQPACSARRLRATSVREIVEAAGVTKPVLYYYFQSKEGIYLAILEETRRIWRRRSPRRSPPAPVPATGSAGCSSEWSRSSGSTSTRSADPLRFLRPPRRPHFELRHSTSLSRRFASRRRGMGTASCGRATGRRDLGALGAFESPTASSFTTGSSSARTACAASSPDLRRRARRDAVGATMKTSFSPGGRDVVAAVFARQGSPGDKRAAEKRQWRSTSRRLTSGELVETVRGRHAQAKRERRSSRNLRIVREVFVTEWVRCAAAAAPGSTAARRRPRSSRRARRCSRRVAPARSARARARRKAQDGRLETARASTTPGPRWRRRRDRRPARAQLKAARPTPRM